MLTDLDTSANAGIQPTESKSLLTRELSEARDRNRCNLADLENFQSIDPVLRCRFQCLGVVYGMLYKYIDIVK